MIITPLGTNASYPGPGNACSGWLLQDGGANVLLDCGTGVIARVQEYLPLQAITAVVISHMHADHFFDLVPLRHALKYGPANNTVHPALYLPPNGVHAMADIASVVHGGAPDEREFISEVFQTAEFDPAAALRVGNLELTFAPGRHYIPSWSVSVRSQDSGHRLVYTADTGPAEAVTDLARGADLLIAEATYLTLDEESPVLRGHMTAAEAGEMAAAAGVHQCLLTHQWPHRNPTDALERAAAVFRGPLENAALGRSYTI